MKISLKEMSRSHSIRKRVEVVEEVRGPCRPALGHVERDAADAVVVVRQPRAAERLDEVVDGLALAERVRGTA